MIKEGQVINDLTVVSFYSEKDKNGKSRRYAKCRCICGAFGVIRTDHLSSGRSITCSGFPNNVNHWSGITTIKFHSGDFAIMDTSDYLIFKEYKMTLDKELGYVVLTIDGKVKRIHREIMKINNESIGIVDHKNRDRADNRRCNLRNTDSSGNNQNKNIGGYSSKFKGVCFRSDIKKWTANISKNKKIFRLGIFVEEIEAAKAYDLKALELYGRDAMTNKSLGLLCE